MFITAAFARSTMINCYTGVDREGVYSDDAVLWSVVAVGEYIIRDGASVRLPKQTW